MKRISKYLFLWAVGGVLYYSFEILFRGFSHWSMFILGGICFLFFYMQGHLLGWEEPLWKQTIRNILFITSLEFITGIIVNKWLGLSVWDYSDLPMHLFGQICIPFMIIFSGLSVLGIFVSCYLGYFLFGDTKPHFSVL